MKTCLPGDALAMHFAPVAPEKCLALFLHPHPTQSNRLFTRVESQNETNKSK
jgi:hypothetical protein